MPRRNDGGFDPVPWIVGAILAGAAYELYKVITGGSSAGPTQLGIPPAVPSSSSGTAPGAYQVPGEGGGANF